MSLLRNIANGLRSLFRKEQVSQELDEELRGFLEMAAEEKMKNGMSRKDALRTVRLERGSLDVSKEIVWSVRWESFVETCWRDLCFGLRQIRRNPGFTLAIIVTLALGVGGNTAIFSILNAVLLRPLPYRNADRLVVVWQENLERRQLDKATAADYNDWLTRSHVFDDLAFSWDASYTLTGAGDPRSTIGYQLSANFFAVLGAPPLLGRTFLPDDGTPGRDHVAVLSYHLWRSQFAADNKIIGRTIQLDDSPYSVVGVMPPEFAHPSATVDLWTPLPFPTGLLHNRELHVFQVIGMLRSGVSLLQAQQQLASLAQENARQDTQRSKYWTVRLQPIRDFYTGDVRPALWVLQASVLLMLMIACANVGNMLLARASTQEREVSIRMALGASGGRLFRQFLTQGLTLAVIGAGVGLLLAWWGVQAVPFMFKAQLANLPLPTSASSWMNWPVLLLTLVITAMISLVFGAIPALRRRNSPSETLNTNSRANTERRASLRLRHALIVCQLALSVLLLVGSGLLARTFLRLQSRSLGFETDHVLTFVLSLSPNRYPNLSKTASVLDQVLTRIQALPGVQSAGAINTLPLSGMDARRPFTVPGAADDSGQPNVAQFRVVSPDYFQAMRIPLRKGRFFSEQDRSGAALVAIVNERLAQRFWPNADPIGQRILVPDTATPLLTEIVGVVGDVRHGGLASESPIEIYRPANQTYWPFFGIVVRTSLDPEGVAASISQAVWSVDRDQPINSIRSMQALAADSIALRRSSMVLMTLFATVAVLLASLGIYSFISYAVSLRTHEIGVRVALGARNQDILRTVVGQTAMVAFVGVASGVIAALGVTKFLSTLLFGVASSDPITLLVAVSIMMAIAAAAAYLPARRATSVDPMAALRHE
jgi:predicted permease